MQIDSEQKTLLQPDVKRIATRQPESPPTLTSIYAGLQDRVEMLLLGEPLAFTILIVHHRTQTPNTDTDLLSSKDISHSIHPS